MTSASNVTINGWTYTGPNPNGQDTFVVIGACTNITISNNTIKNVLRSVTQYQGSNNGPILITGNEFHTGVNTLSDTDIIELGDTGNVTIEKNKIVHEAVGSQTNGRHNDVIQNFRSGANSNQSPYGWIIRYNWIEINLSTAYEDGSNSFFIMQQLANGTAGFALKIYGNVFLGDGTVFSGGNGLSLYGVTSSVNVYQYNNTYVRKNGPSQVPNQGPGTMYFRNNVFQDNTGPYVADFQLTGWNVGSTYDYNFAYHTPDCNSTVSGSHGSCSVDPLFTDYTKNDFSTQSESPLISAADSSIGSEYNQGIAPGATWPNPKLVTRPAGAWDVGAYQSATTVTVLPPTSVSATVR
jgi:hypothetical protein